MLVVLGSSFSYLEFKPMFYSKNIKQKLYNV